MNEDDRAFGRGGTGAVGGSKNLKAIVDRAPAARRAMSRTSAAWKAARKLALDAIRDEKNITSPKKGGLSVYGTNVLMNVTNSIGALGARNSQLTSFGERAESLSGEYVEQNILVGQSHLPRLPGRVQEGGRDQGRPLEGAQDGERRVRAGLGARRQLRQRRHRARSPS